MKSIKSILAVILLLSFAPVKAQIYLADNGLTASGSGTSTKVSLGGTLNNAATSVDFGSANSSSNFLFKKGSSNYFFIGNDGKIGVGTNSPGSSLDIVMASTSQPALTLKSIASQAASTYTFDLKDASGTRVVGIRPTDGLTYGDGVLTINA
ncbi:MAG TPA: hypothetical protein VIZ28_13740, partial [Chitinophagaceae bacterium]